MMGNLGGTISPLSLQGLYFSGLLDILPFDLLDNLIWLKRSAGL
jgi:hypothetical protein